MADSDREFDSNGFALEVMALPGVYVNGFSCMVDEDVLRLGVIDQIKGQSVARVHLVMTEEAATALAIVIARTLEVFRQKRNEQDAAMPRKDLQ